MPSDEILVKEASELSLEDLRNVKRMLDERSGAHCLAKWYQVTLNLHNGRSASCCLQPSKPLNLEAIHEDIDNIHNSSAHVEERVALRNGQKIGSCSACWNVEKDGKFSERHFKSADSWAVEKMPESDGDPRHINPTYVEVSFSSQCQLRCSYCNPDTSSSIAKEIEQNGAYPDRYTLMSIEDRSSRGVLPLSEQPDTTNPYVKAFWQWLPTVYKDLKVLRVTGGEPFLSEDTFKFMDYVKENPNPNMAIEFNSNLSFPSAVFNRFEKAFSLIPRKNYKTTTLYVSLDCWGERAEYIRFGMRIKEIEKNIERLLSQFPQMRLTITSTISVLGIQTFDELLSKVLELKDKWGAHRISLTAYPLVFPPFQAVALASEPLKAELQRVEAKALASNIFSVREKEMIGAISSSSKQVINSELLKKLKIDFYRFFKTYDERKKTSLTNLFPEHRKLFEEGQKFSDKEKNDWLQMLHSENSQQAVVAIQHLRRAYPLDDNAEHELVSRLANKDDLTLPYLQSFKSFSERSIGLIKNGVLLKERANDLMRLINSNAYLKERFEVIFNSIELTHKNFSLDLFYIWNRSAVEYSVDTNIWAHVLSNFYSKCQTANSKNQLVASTKGLPKKYTDSIGPLDETIHSAFLKRVPIHHEESFVSLFKPENVVLLEFLPEYLSSIELDLKIAKALIRVAKDKKQFAGQIAKGLGIWRGKMNLCLNELKDGDAYVNALIAKYTGLDAHLPQTLFGLSDDEISQTLAQWAEADLKVDSNLLAAIILDKTLLGNIPYKWVSHCKLVTDEKDLVNGLVAEYIDSHVKLSLDQSNDFFEMIKLFDLVPEKTILQKFLACASETTLYSFVLYTKKMGLVNELIEDYLSRVEFSNGDEKCSLFYNVFIEQEITVDQSRHLKALFSSKSTHWGLWELIVGKEQPNKLIVQALQILNTYSNILKVVEHSYFKYFFKTKSKDLDLTVLSSQNIPYWWVSFLDESSLLTNELAWSALLSVKNDVEYWSIRSYLEQVKSLDFELRSVNNTSMGDDAKYDLVCLLLDKKNVQDSIVNIYSIFMENLGSKYIWSLLERINQNDVEITNLGFFVQAFVQANLTDESYYSHIISILDKISSKTKIDQSLDINWINFNSIFIDALQIMDPSKREWILNQFLDANFFNVNLWDTRLLQELDKIDSHLLYVFSERTNLKEMSYYDSLLDVLPLTAIFAARQLPCDNFVKKLNLLENEEGFYCLQLRCSGLSSKDWSIEQVNTLKPLFKDEFYKLSKDLFPTEFWSNLSISSESLCVVSALYLDSSDFCTQLNAHDLYHSFLAEVHVEKLSNTNDLDHFYKSYKNLENDVADIFEQIFLKHHDLPISLLHDIILRFVFSKESERIIFRIKGFDFVDVQALSFSEDVIQELIQKNLILRTVKILTELEVNSYALDLALKYALESDDSIDIKLAPLYFLCERNVLKKVDAINKFIATLCEIPLHSQICWNLVDIIIDNKLDRSKGYKSFVTSPLVQRVKPERPFLKLLAYFKGIVHSSADM